MKRLALAILLAGLALAPGTALAQMVPSTCHAVAEAVPRATFVSMGGPTRLAQIGEDVTITYVTHATYRIESPGGVVVATDFAGYAGETTPDIVTMNKAHSSHNTPFPDPGIPHVLRGWNPEGGPARHALTVDDMYVRNVPTDIRSYGGMEPDGNSIFIFEVAGLCIGHLGHLHHRLTDADFAQIGRLDIVMVPVDGGLTMSQEGIGEITERLRSSIVLPMHRFSGPIERFLARLPDFAVERRDEPSFTVSVRTLPRTPTVIVLAGV
ncbi:MBL fold metallo-hydrolase [Aurantimonas sp. HBX-1]|uniref:MBL fold metallo-hydrolase n=1 Tax=Aurantimonas sp. HBX-1 TaxID=2906072 RepID=UPI001F2DF9BA|nr:MBL fold metallo-hydrolase [Aurantimonas sp. HBX-1]UIJ70837.1 MBL fold metallo-hydrolase [Aurantimonas sp. HBX-1]